MRFGNITALSRPTVRQSVKHQSRWVLSSAGWRLPGLQPYWRRYGASQIHFPGQTACFPWPALPQKHQCRRQTPCPISVLHRGRFHLHLFTFTMPPRAQLMIMTPSFIIPISLAVICIGDGSIYFIRTVPISLEPSLFHFLC